MHFPLQIEGLKCVGVLEELIAHVLGNTGEGSHGANDRDIRRRVELFLDQDEEDVEAIIVDLRRHNKSSEVYNRFYKMMAEYLNTEETKADARR